MRHGLDPDRTRFPTRRQRALARQVEGPRGRRVATATDDGDESIVCFVNDGKLSAVVGDNGKLLVVSSETCDGVEQWTTLIAVKGRIVAGADGQLCSWSVH